MITDVTIVNFYTEFNVLGGIAGFALCAWKIPSLTSSLHHGLAGYGAARRHRNGLLCDTHGRGHGGGAVRRRSSRSNSGEHWHQQQRRARAGAGVAPLLEQEQPAGRWCARWRPPQCLG